MTPPPFSVTPPPSHLPALLEFILEDFRARFDLATAWLFSEYSREEGYLYGAPPPPPPQHGHPHAPSKYTVCLTELMLGAKDKLDPRDRLFSKLVLEAPKVTHEALHIIRSYCQDEVRNSALMGVRLPSGGPALSCWGAAPLGPPSMQLPPGAWLIRILIT